MSGFGAPPSSIGALEQYYQTMYRVWPTSPIIPSPHDLPKRSEYVEGRDYWPVYGSPNPEDVANGYGDIAIRIALILWSPILLGAAFLLVRYIVAVVT